MANVLQMVKSMAGIGDDDVGYLVGEIEATRAKGLASSAELERLDEQRLVADDYDAAKSIEARIDRVRFECDKLAAALPLLENRLAIARNAKQKAAIARHAAANRKAWPKFRAAILAAVDAQEEMIKMRTDAGKEIGEHAVALNLPVQAFAGFLRRENFDIWDSELSRVMADPPPQPAVAAVIAPRVAPTPARPVGVTDRRAVEKPVAPVAPVKPKRPLHKSKVTVGDRMLIVMLRANVEINGELSMVGDQIDVPTEQANSLLRQGAAERVSNT
jgi:hypothetical protein